MPEESDAEVKAISTIVGALEPLNVDAKSRVVEYVLKRLGIVLPVAGAHIAGGGQMQHAPTSGQHALPSAPPGAIKDIKTLRDEKSPSSANQMAALGTSA